MRAIIPLLLLIPLTACDQFDRDASGYFPVIGQRCEHWQCFTDEGRAKSEVNQMERLCSKPETAEGLDCEGVGKPKMIEPEITE